MVGPLGTGPIDTFERADGLLAAPWFQFYPSDGFRIIGGQLAPPATPGWTAMYYGKSFGGAQEVWARFDTVPSADAHYIYLQLHPNLDTGATQDNYAIEADSDYIGLLRTVNGSAVVLDSTPHDENNFIDGDALALAIEGDDVNVYRWRGSGPWVKILGATDTTHRTDQMYRLLEIADVATEVRIEEFGGFSEAAEPAIPKIAAEAPVVVRLLALDGTWETAGRDRYPAVLPESLQLTYNEWGPDTASFVLHRQPGDLHPDLSAFTDAEIEIGGVLVWTGRVRETPTKDGSGAQISVAGQGWQYHLDDDAYERMYVHTNLSDWQDTRSLLNASLVSSAWAASSQIEVGEGRISFGVPNANTMTLNQHVGVTLDLGPGNAAKKIVLDMEHLNFVNAAFTFVIRGHDGDNPNPPSGQYEDTTIAGESWTNGIKTATFSTPRRYITVFFYRDNGSGAVGSDHMLIIKSAKVFAETAYESGNASVLKASAIVKDARTRATTKLSSADTHIENTTFNLDEFTLVGARTPREVLTAVNSYHDYLMQVNVWRELVFKSKPSTPLLATGAGALFEDASANSGEEIYNKTVVEGQGPAGDGLRVTRRRTDPIFVPVSPTHSNPSFTTNTTGWTATQGSITRVTTAGTFHTSPAAAELTTNSDSNRPTAEVTTSAFTGTWRAGRLYRVRIYLDPGTWFGSQFPLTITLTIGSDTASVIWYEYGLPNEYQPFDVYLRPKQDSASATLTINIGGTSPVTSAAFIDTLEIGEVAATLPDRRRFDKTKLLPVQSRITQVTGEQIADVFLTGHSTTPLKGTLSHPGRHALQHYSTGEPIPPWEAGLYVGELVNMGHLIDPDTGAIGRDGRVAGVTYSHADRRAEVQIDNRRNNFEAFLERLALVTGAAGIR